MEHESLQPGKAAPGSQCQYRAEAAKSLVEPSQFQAEHAFQRRPGKLVGSIASGGGEERPGLEVDALV